MLFFKYIYNCCSTDIAKFYLQAIALLLVALFTFVQWGLPLYWERQPNFKMSFVKSSGNNYIQAEPLIGEKEQCIIAGSIDIKNESKAPLFLKDTDIVLIPYNVKRCSLDNTKCISSLNTPPSFINAESTLADTKVKDLLSRYHHTTIQPVVRDHDLFSGGTVSRPFSLLVPTSQLRKEKMIVLAIQQYGAKSCWFTEDENDWYKSKCLTSRAVINVTWPCIVPSQKLNTTEQKSSKISL